LRPPATDPWRLILQENVVYLADDETREQALRLLERQTGLDAETLENGPDALLRPACELGRMAANQIAKLRECGRLFRTVGDPRRLVRLEPAAARKALRRFPGIGAPGAERLLLLAGVEPVLALESNGLRVLLRLGYGHEARSYSTRYRLAREAAAAELPADVAVLTQAHLALRQHGRRLCRNSDPACGDCPLRADCPGRV